MLDAALSVIHDRIGHLESQIGEIRLTVLTQDDYIERRNREDKHIQREFYAHKSVSDRIDANVTTVKMQVAQIESTLSQLQVDVTSLKNQVRGCVGEIVNLRITSTGMQTEIVNLHATVTEMQNDIKKLFEQNSSMGRRFEERFEGIEKRFDGIEKRFDGIEKRFEKHVDDFTVFKNRMTQANATRFNPLAYDLNSFITPVPKLDEDGALHYPSYFPDTVWHFWRLKQPRNRECT
jgi:chromosome segregation ATPase